MTELQEKELDVVVEQEEAEVKQVQTDRELSAFEQRMVQHGWDPNGKLSAEDWIENGFNIKNKKLDNLFKAVDDLKTKLAKQEKEAFAKARAELEAKRIEAIELADVERVREIEKQTQSLVDPSVKEHVDAFMNKHSAWLNGTSYREQEMQMVCRQKDQELMSEGLPPELHMKKLENFITGKFAEYFNQPTHDIPIQNVETEKKTSTVKSKSKKMTFEDLDEFQKKAALGLQKSIGLSIDDYIKRLQQLD